MKNTFLVKHETGMKKYRRHGNCHTQIYQKDLSEKELFLRYKVFPLFVFSFDHKAVSSRKVYFISGIIKVLTYITYFNFSFLFTHSIFNLVQVFKALFLKYVHKSQFWVKQFSISKIWYIKNGSLAPIIKQKCT